MPFLRLWDAPSHASLRTCSTSHAPRQGDRAAMDAVLPLLLIIGGLVAAIFLALGILGRFARTSIFDTDASTAAVALRTPAERLAAKDAYADKRSIRSSGDPLDTPGSLKGGIPDVPVTIEEDDPEASSLPPSSPTPPEFLPVKEDAPKEPTEHAQDNIPASPAIPLPSAATIAADAGPSASPSDGGLGAGCDDAEQPASRAVRDSGETLRSRPSATRCQRLTKAFRFLLTLAQNDQALRR
jgi:hypothetical protein